MVLISGLSRGIDVYDIGVLISVFVGNKVLGRMFDVLGNLIDLKDVFDVEKMLIHVFAFLYEE